MLELVFFTGSRIKLSHAKHLLNDVPVKVLGIQEKSYHASYIEPRIYDRKKLLEESYYSALEQAKKARLNLDFPFVLEDTSVNIYALSKKYKKETPGLDVKYWMQEVEFESLDRELKELGNNRSVEVRSDLIVHIPERLREKYNSDYLHFTGRKYGRIVESEAMFSTQPLYPWLDNKTFNKWFVPADEDKPISMLKIELADKHDFRKSCFRQLVEFLKEEGFYSHDHDKTEVVSKKLSFSKNYVFVGLQCAGKTTLAQYICSEYGYFHVEASDFMHLLYREKHSSSSDVTIGSFAKELLEKKPTEIARMVVAFLEENDCFPFVLTGFRKKEEVDFLLEYFNHMEIEAIFIDSEYETRLQRFHSRARKQKEEFKNRDLREDQMGLGVLKDTLSNVANNSSLDSLFEGFVTSEHLLRGQVEPYSLSNTRDLFRKIILALESEWIDEVETPFMTTTEISKKINSLLSPNEKKKHKDNVSRFFNQKDSVFFEQVLEEGKTKYRLSNTGYSLALLIKG